MHCSPIRRLKALLFIFVVVPTFFVAPSGGGLALDGPLAHAQQDSEAKRSQDLARAIMSPFCPGRTLQACPSPYAGQWREDIRQWVKEGVSSQEIRNRLKARMPDKDLTGAPSTVLDNILPAALSVLAIVLLVLLLRKMLSPAVKEGDAEAAARPKQSDAVLDEQLDDELAELD